MINQMREQGYHVEELCSAFGVSKSGYYADKRRADTPRKVEEKRIVARIKDIHSDRHMRSYGSPRMTAELNSLGYRCSTNRVARLMNKHGVNARQRAAFRPKTTISDRSNAPSPNRLKHGAEPTAPGNIYVSDITYVATREGWLYLAVIIDLLQSQDRRLGASRSHGSIFGNYGIGPLGLLFASISKCFVPLRSGLSVHIKKAS